MVGCISEFHRMNMDYLRRGKMKFTFDDNRTDETYNATLKDFVGGNYYVIEWKPTESDTVPKQYIAIKSDAVLRVLTEFGMPEYDSDESINCRIIRKVSEIRVI
jgi:uncharacterized protein (DUF1015 family)